MVHIYSHFNFFANLVFFLLFIYLFIFYIFDIVDHDFNILPNIEKQNIKQQKPRQILKLVYVNKPDNILSIHVPSPQYARINLSTLIEKFPFIEIPL